MNSIFVEDNDKELTIRIKKADFDDAFIQNILKRIEFERLSRKAEFDPSILSYLKQEFSSHWNESEAKHYSARKP